MIWDAIWLTAMLALSTTLVLLVLGMPLAWWLAHSRSRWRAVIEAVTALPLVLPPTVLGFYLLMLFSPASEFGQFWISLTGHSLTFSFSGLLIASVVYSLPFMVQPLQAAFATLGKQSLEVASSLGASPGQGFWRIILPQARAGVMTAAVLTFAHTLGEFGVVLMVGGNIPGKTQVISIALFEQVETLNYGTAHWLSAGMLLFSFVVLFGLYSLRRKGGLNVG